MIIGPAAMLFISLLCLTNGMDTLNLWEHTKLFLDGFVTKGSLQGRVASHQEHKRFLNVCVTFAYSRSQTENEQNTNGA